MTLGNMRALGVTAVLATCQAVGCGHDADVDVSALQFPT
jgi:hypothetical protein